MSLEGGREGGTDRGVTGSFRVYAIMLSGVLVLCKGGREGACIIFLVAVF